MSMSLFVILALESQPNSSELNSVAVERGYAVELAPDIDFRSHSGFIPATVDDAAAGFELYVFPVAEVEGPLSTVIPDNYHEGIVYQLSFGYRSQEARAAFSTAVGMNVQYGGITIEDQGGTILSVEQLQDGMAAFSE